ncbi:hypothetical protein [Cupriavidus sp. WS]|uniref:hypothetical protein n=1 Tax=Cupriavidus sp. WS TaxID=1312922 RepID=UPI0012DCEB4A|nr:hypothetical protein [Cupriavidus sp. WS]
MEDTRIVRAMVDLWKLSYPGPSNLYSAPEFLELKAACQEVHPGIVNTMNGTVALSIALRALGLPCGLPESNGVARLEPYDAARALAASLTRASAERIIMCPLDLADSLPDLNFGPCTVRTFSQQELYTHFHGCILARMFPGRPLDVSRLAQFTWLCVREELTLSDPGRRAAPFLYETVSDWGSIEPHATKFPTVVEQALFLLLLEPWEDWANFSEWRAFHVPWTYASSDDLFEHRTFPPGPDSLSWQLQTFEDYAGEQIEIEVPGYLPLDSEAKTAASSVTHDAWSSLMSALASPLFETPIVHFFVRAYSSDGIDEFLGHMLAIEAALGLESDYRGQKPMDTIRGSMRIQCRVSALLGSTAEGQSYGRLFQLRSMFLHGRSMGRILAQDRQSARSLARRVVKATIVQAIADSTHCLSREAFVTALLEQGAQMHGLE